MQECIGKAEKQIFIIKVDSIRKSLGIDSMEDVELLVGIFYEYSDRQKELQKAEELDVEEEKKQESSRRPKDEDRRAGGINEEGEYEDPVDDEEEDDEELYIDPDSVVEILREFHKKREDNANNAELTGNPRMKKRSNFETEEQKRERIKKEERKFWEKMTTVLSESKQGLWRALDSALAKYYQLLVDRQNLIEETGLLNQQNEELKTLLNQYLQAGVNHELQVPPTQVIRLDI